MVPVSQGVQEVLTRWLVEDSWLGAWPLLNAPSGFTVMLVKWQGWDWHPARGRLTRFAAPASSAATSPSLGSSFFSGSTVMSRKLKNFVKLA